MISQASAADLLREKSCFVIDLDGVVYKGKQAIAGASAAIQKFRELDKKIAFLTNNSASSTETIMHKLHSFGISCDRQEILTAAQASASYIAQHQIDQGKGVLVIGTDALKDEVIEHGLRLADADHCGVVLVGLDPKFDYAAIAIALRALTQDAIFVACNRDANFPVEGGYLSPGCGAMVGAIESAIAREADFEIGKPNTIMLDILSDRMQVLRTDCLMIGDMLASDILMANNANIASIWISETLIYPNQHINKRANKRTNTHINEEQNSPQPSFCMSSLDQISQIM